MAGKNDKPSNMKEVDVETMDELLGTSAATVIAPDDASNKSVLSSTKVDTSFLDNNEEEEEDDDVVDDSSKNEDDDEEVSKQNAPKTEESLDDILDEDDDEDLDDDEGKSKGGRKPALVEAMSKLVEKGTLALFEDKEDLSEYTTEEIVELVEANFANQLNDVAQKAPMDVFSKLDPKIQEVVAYNLNGGADVTSVLKNVTRSQEISKLDPSKEEDAERIAREWLTETNFGTPEEIEEEISAYTDREELVKKANQFKPKLDKKAAEIMEKKLKQQEEKRKQAEEVQKQYAETIFNTLNKPDLNGLPLNNKIQTSLYNGITNTSQYQDRNGNKTNELGYLIENYQLNPKANKGVLLEALWLLKDPQGYRDQVQNIAVQKKATQIKRELKTSEGKRKTASQKQGEEREVPKKRTAVKRKEGSRNIFSR